MTRPVMRSIRMNAITIGSYNIQKGIGIDLRRDIRRTADVLSEMNCDLVGLQEVVLDERDPSQDQARFLGERLGMTVVVGPTRPHGERAFGNVVLSRFPVRRVHRLDLSVGRHEPRGCLRVDVEAPSGVVHVYNCHFGLSPFERASQLARLVSFLRETEGPRVVMGDFNEWYDGPITRELWRELTTDPPTVPRTHPAFFPWFALDRLYADEALRGGAIEVHATPKARVASDHRPIRIRLEPQRQASQGVPQYQ